MTLLNAINLLSVLVIAIVCALSIIKYHRQFGLIITLTILFLLLSCVSVLFDEYDGTRGLFALPTFRLLAATSSVILYLKARRFWQRYGVFVIALKQQDDVYLSSQKKESHT